MKTFSCWCAANVGIIGVLFSVLVVGVTCLFRMEELRYLGYVPLLIWPLSFFFIYPGKTNQDVLVRFFFLFGALAFLFVVSYSGKFSFSPDTLYMVKSTMMKMTLIGIFVAFEVTLFVSRNFSEVTSRRMLYRNSSVEMFDIRLKYCIHQLFESFMVTASIVLLVICGVELKPTVEALEAGDMNYWTIEIVRFVKQITQ